MPLLPQQLELAARSSAQVELLWHVPLTENEWQVILWEVAPSAYQHYRDQRMLALSAAMTSEQLRGSADLRHEDWLALNDDQKYGLIVHAAIRRCDVPVAIATNTGYTPTGRVVRSLKAYEPELQLWESALQTYVSHPLQRPGVKDIAAYQRQLRRDVLWFAVALWLSGSSYSALTRQQLRAYVDARGDDKRARVWMSRAAKALLAAGHPAVTPELIAEFGYQSESVEKRSRRQWALIEIPDHAQDNAGEVDHHGAQVPTDLKGRALRFVAVLKAACHDAQTTFNENGTYTLRKMSVRRVIGIEREIRHFVNWSVIKGIVNWSDATATSSFAEYYQARKQGSWSPPGSRKPGPLGVRHLRNVRTALRMWLGWEAYGADPSVDVDILMPYRITRSVKKYSLPPDTSLIVGLLVELISNQAGLIDDTKHFDFYARRAALLLCLTGLRPSEVLRLHWDCIRSHGANRTPFQGVDKNGERFEYWILQVNKTKTNPLGRSVQVQREVAERIFELQDITPKLRTVLVSSDGDREPGDDLDTFRLFPSSPEQVGIIRVGFLNRWMARLQRRNRSDAQEATSIRFLTPYDLRRMRVSTLKMLQVSRRDIAKHLGHKDLQVQDEYHTNQDWMASKLHELAKKNPVAGMVLRNEDPLEPQEVVAAREIGRQLINTPAVEELAEFLVNEMVSNPALRDLASSEQAKATMPTGGLSVPFAMAPLYGGIPLTTLNCSAHVFIDCHSNDLTCGSCQWYKPDPDLVFEHEVYLFRCYVYANFSKAESRELPLGLRKTVSIKLEGTDEAPGWLDRIESMLQTTFGTTQHGFGYSSDQLAGFRKYLQAKATSYWRRYSKTRPDPTTQEAMEYLGTSFFQQ